MVTRDLDLLPASVKRFEPRYITPGILLKHTLPKYDYVY